MLSKNKVVAVLFAAVFFGAGLSGCVKKRSERDAQGSGLRTGDTVEKSTLDGKTFPLVTTGVIGDGRNTLAQTLVVESDVEYINNLSYVNYTTDATLLGPDVMIKALPNNSADYAILYRIQGNQLVVYKTGPKNKIPSQEWTYAEDLGGGKIAVPLVAYPATHYNVVKILNEDERETNTRTEIPVTDADKLSQATHIRINTTDRRAFEPLEKQDSFDKNIFLDGEWQLNIELIEVSDDLPDGELLGFILTGNKAGRGGFSESIKVRFKAYADRLAAENLNIDPRLTNKPENYPEILNLPVKAWLNPVVLSDKATKDLKETNLINNSDATQAPKVQIDFSKMSCNNCTTFDPEETYQFSKLEISKNQISWIMKAPQYSVRYNLIKPNWRPFLARNFPENEERRFGSINTFRDYRIFNAEDNNAQAVYLNRKVTRLAPGQEVVYHATGEGANEPWVDEVVGKATETWNRVFAHVYKGYKDQNGVAIQPPRISYSKERKNKGDSRFFKINVTAKNNVNTSLGIGNPHYDSATGQIYSATSHVYLAATEMGAARTVYDYIYAKVGAYDSTLLVSGADNLVLVRNGDALSSSMESYTFGNVSYLPNLFTQPGLLSSIYGENGRILDTSKLNQAIGFTMQWTPMMTAFDGEQKAQWDFAADQKVMSDLGVEPGAGSAARAVEAFKASSTELLLNDRRLDSHVHKLDTFSISSDASVYLIEKECPEVVALVTRLTQSNQQGLPRYDKSEVSHCVAQLVKHDMYNTILHEMGHNFGLAHNFYGSSDKPNWPTQAWADEVYGAGYIELPPRLIKTSSIMDYSGLGGNFQELLGPYDVEAIRYIYTSRVKDTDNKLVSLVTSTDLEKATETVDTVASVMEKQGKQARNYKYCSNSDLYTNKDPLCAMFDEGGSAEEVVKSLEKSYRFAVQSSRARLNKAFSSNEYQRASRMMSFYYARMKRFYDEWRLNLKDVVGTNDMYLEKFDVDTWANLIVNITGQDTAHSKKLLDYYKARNVVYNFFRDQAFSTNQYCEADLSDASGQLLSKEYVEFSQARVWVKLLSDGDNSVLTSSCINPSIEKAIEVYYKQINPKVATAKVVGEVGEPLNSYHFSLDPQNSDRPFDVFGSGMLRMASFFQIINRAPISMMHLNDTFFPNMLDEPDIRSVLRDDIIDRIMNGVRIQRKSAPDNYAQSFVDQMKQAVPALTSDMTKDNFMKDPLFLSIYAEGMPDTLKQEQKPATYDNVFYEGAPALISYNEEKMHVAEVFRLYVSGLTVPGKFETTINRLKPFMMYPVSRIYEAQLASIPDKVDMGVYYLLPNPDAYVAKQFVQNYNAVDAVIQGTFVDSNKMSTFVASTLPALIDGIRQAEEATALPTEQGKTKAAVGAEVGAAVTSAAPVVAAAPVSKEITFSELLNLSGTVANFLENSQDYSAYEKVLINQSLEAVIQTTAGSQKVKDGEEEVGLGNLFQERAQLTNMLNQIGGLGDGLSEMQREQKTRVTERLATVEGLIHAAGDVTVSETLGQPFNLSILENIMLTQVAQSNATQERMNSLKKEMEAQKELTKLIFRVL